jgi:hypothetical protein
VREQSVVISKAFARLLALLSTLAGLVGLSFAALAAPLILQKGGGGGSGGSSGGGSPSQGSSRPSFQVNEPQYAVFPAIAFSGTEAKNLVIMEKKAKEARLASATGDVSGRLATDIDEERASGLTRWNSMDAMTTDGPRGGTLTGFSSPILAGFRGGYPSSPVSGDAGKARGPYRDIHIASLSGFQTANRNAKNQTFSDLVLTISRDPTAAAAVGTDVIVGSIARPFVNAAGKVGEEMVRQVQCASQGQLAASGCGEATPWQDYWGTLMTGEGEAYTAGALALDALTIGAGPTIAGMSSDAAVAVLKKVPEGLEGLAKSVAKGTERIRAGYAASGFADETGAILVREGERVSATITREVSAANGIIEVQKVIGPSKFQEILQTPKGSRPPPETYLSQEYISKHLAEFDDGAARFMKLKDFERFGPSREDGTSFVMSKRDADTVQTLAAGDRSAFETALGYKTGSLKDAEMVRLDIPDPNNFGLRVPSGNEAGANPLWLPGGRLPEGWHEAILDLRGAPGGSWIVTPVRLN